MLEVPGKSLVFQDFPVWPSTGPDSLFHPRLPSRGVLSPVVPKQTFLPLYILFRNSLQVKMYIDSNTVWMKLEQFGCKDQEI